jgi:hypothetical protein
MTADGDPAKLFFEIKGLTFKMSMVYDGHRFEQAISISPKTILPLEKEVI